MGIKQKVTSYSLEHYKRITLVMVISTLALGALIPLIKVDTDPENMLSPDEPVRVFHDQTKKSFSLSDIVVVGIINDKDPNGVFNPQSLARVYELTEYAKIQRWPDKDDPNEQVGVIAVDLMAPSTVDHIGQGRPDEVEFEWLMSKPPATQAEALQIRDKAMSNPMLKGTVVSEDGKAICLYLPLTSKHLSHEVYKKLMGKIETFTGDEEYHITGLPVAEDTFGVEMFIQMAISAPLAMVVIFLLMLLFFRKLVLVISPMIVAMVSVISTMGLLIGFGFPVHIMSSMIPIFLMPIAVVDSVHILSEFFDLYTKEKNRKETTIEVIGHLFMPMLYTSLTSAAGFASLALTPIPPVQVFGVFVAIGIMIAWVCTITFVPAYIMMIKESSLENFGSGHSQAEAKSGLGRLLAGGGNFTYSKAKPILVVILIAALIAIYGITRIEINDNPVRWFAESDPIRKADDRPNKHFVGTYMAYLVLDPNDDGTVQPSYVSDLRTRLSEKLVELKEEFPNVSTILPEAEKKLFEESSPTKTKDELLDELSTYANDKVETVAEKDVDVWYEIADFFELETERLKLFKQPDVLRYISRLQEHLGPDGLKIVGKSNSVADVVKKVHQELIDGKDENYRIPNSPRAVAECLFQFQSSHKPDDLWHLVTTDYMRANIWMQLPSGDNKDMEKVVKAVDEFLAETPPPVPLQHSWAGLTYINTVWQDKMVWGMLQSFMGSFIIVFIMMAILFRSPLWGLVCMVPLLITIAVIYGIIGLVGKDYDMPVAVLSALTLGMAVDFAIHFLERARASYAETGSWQRSASVMFGEPARAIARNVFVIAIGFLPLLAAPLIPYKTVGIFLCAIMALSGAVTLLALPAIITLAEKVLFRRIDESKPSTCKCAFCFIISMAVVVLVAVNLHQYWELGWGAMALLSVAAIATMTVACGLISRRQACRTAAVEEKKLQENENLRDES
ncbi:MAG: efflux RND transporter permease subunit [Planctomycetota bacterium]|jgi:predicted RND superfamily exporter protein